MPNHVTSGAHHPVRPREDQVVWRTGSRCEAAEHCVGVAELDADCIGIRDTADPDIPPMRITRAEWAVLAAAVKAGSHDLATAVTA